MVFYWQIPKPFHEPRPLHQHQRQRSSCEGTPTHSPLEVYKFNDQHPNQGFLPKLKRHLFPRVIEELIQDAQDRPDVHASSIPTLRALATSFEEEDLNNLHFHSNCIFRHGVFKTRYTTYDCRGDHDTFNPSTSKRDFMCLREAADGETCETEDGGRYHYGRILGIFHANIQYSGPGAFDFRRRRFDFLWVRWFLSEGKVKQWSDKQHDIVSLAPLVAPTSCDFVDPLDVLRAAHIVPRFASGLLYDPASSTNRLFSKHARDRADWREYYVNR